MTRPSLLASLTIAALTLSCSCALFADDAKDLAKPTRIDFSSDKPQPGSLPANWDYRSTWGVPDGKFQVVKDAETGTNVLKLESDKSSGTLLYYKLVGKLDLNKTPIIRWKWKVSKLPPGADGRFEEKDDQAIDIYVGFGRILRKSVSYRWETETPIGSAGNAHYSKVVSVRWFCLRNKTSPLDKWFVEERNLAEDFKKEYGEVPGDVVLSLSVNSQYTSSRAEAYLEYVEFLPLDKAASATPAPSPKAESK